jgi:thiol-disulfide isomerase/thioredoxin
MKTAKKSLFGLFLLGLCLGVPKVRVVNYEGLKKASQKENDTLYVVNFWATWCKPCVQEFPYFMESAKKFKDQKVKVIFVSLNSEKELANVQKFSETRNVQQEMLLLNAGNPNVWIDLIDKSWDGSIPATVIYKQNKKVFFREGEFEQTELDSIINLKK